MFFDKSIGTLSVNILSFFVAFLLSSFHMSSNYHFFPKKPLFFIAWPNNSSCRLQIVSINVRATPAMLVTHYEVENKTQLLKAPSMKNNRIP